MKILAQTIKGRGPFKGYVFEKVQESEAGYIYKQEGYGFVHHIAFKKNFNERFNCESFPGVEAYGNWAFCCSNMEIAEERLKNL